MILASFSLSGKMPVLNTCFINIVRCLTIVGAICFKNFDEMLSNPVLLLVGRLNTVLITIDSSTSFNDNLKSSLFLRGPLIFVRIIMQWYTTQKACARWGSVVSDNFLITNGARQGGILSPLFF